MGKIITLDSLRQKSNEAPEWIQKFHGMIRSHNADVFKAIYPKYKARFDAGEDGFKLFEEMKRELDEKSMSG